MSGERPGALVAAVFGLVAMIAWTLAVKYLAPWCWFVAERHAGRSPVAVPVMWDFWPLLHSLLAVGLWRRWRRAWPLASPCPSPKSPS